MKYFIAFCLILNGCMGVGGHGKNYKFFTKNGDYKKYNTYDYDFELEAKLKTMNRGEVEYCIYGIMYLLIPFNFWDISFVENYEIKKAIKQFNAFALIDVTTYTYGFSSPIFSYGCTQVKGIVIDETNFNIFYEKHKL